MLIWLYKKILKKLNLSEKELKDLKIKLAKENVCTGPFISEGKMCPNTTALAIKEKVSKFQNSHQVRQLFKKHGIVRIELWSFYALFDIPAKISESFFDKAIQRMKNVTDDLLNNDNPTYQNQNL